MVHCELHTGIYGQYPRNSFSDSLIQSLWPLATSPRGTVPVANDCTIQTSRRGENVVFIIFFRGLIPITVSSLVVEKDDEIKIWNKMTRLASWSFPQTDLRKPLTRPWLASTLLPGYVHALEAGIFWLPDFQRRFAWALLETSPGITMDFSI
jgi:hypothetical protein